MRPLIFGCRVVGESTTTHFAIDDRVTLATVKVEYRFECQYCGTTSAWVPSLNAAERAGHKHMREQHGARA